MSTNAFPTARRLSAALYMTAVIAVPAGKRGGDAYWIFLFNSSTTGGVIDVTDDIAGLANLPTTRTGGMVRVKEAPGLDGARKIVIEALSRSFAYTLAARAAEHLMVVGE